MPVTYHCENPSCPNTATALWVTIDQGKRVIIPPLRWRLVDVEEPDADPVLLCVTCGEIWEAHKQAKKSRRAVLGVLEGGLTGVQPTIPAGSGPAAVRAFLRPASAAPADVSDGVCSVCGALGGTDARIVEVGGRSYCDGCAPPAPRAA